MNEFPIPTHVLRAYLPHRPPMIWVDEVIEARLGEAGLEAVCRVDIRHPADRGFVGADGSVRPSAVIEWIAQGYGFAKAGWRRGEGYGLAGFGRAVLVAIANCEVNLDGIDGAEAVLVRVREVREMHPAYIVDGRVTSLDGAREFGSARITVFGGEIPGAPAVAQ